MKKVKNYKIDGSTQKGDCCPECKADWDGGDILEHFIDVKEDKNHKDHGYYSERSYEDLLKMAGDYGWTVQTKRRFGHLIGVELSYDDPRHYDGISFWQCPECGIAWDRFSGDRTDEFVKYHIERGRKLEEAETYATNQQNKEEDGTS